LVEKHRTHIDYDSKACILRKGIKKFTIQSVVTSVKKSVFQKAFSTLQFKKAIQKDCQPLLVHLKKVK
jgi:hypothetical protein